MDLTEFDCTTMQARKRQVEIHELVKNVRLAWIAHAVQKLPPTSQITIDQQLVKGGILRKFCQCSSIVEDAEGVNQMLDNANSSSEKTSAEALQQIQAKIFRKLVDSEQATRFYDDALDFAKKFALDKPRNEDMKGFLAPLDPEMRRALDIPLDDALSKERRPQGWIE